MQVLIGFLNKDIDLNSAKTNDFFSSAQENDRPRTFKSLDNQPNSNCDSISDSETEIENPGQNENQNVGENLNIEENLNVAENLNGDISLVNDESSLTRLIYIINKSGVAR
ncbi:unnamed protein product, partial [Brachionus calyciflorus]